MIMNRPKLNKDASNSFAMAPLLYQIPRWAVPSFRYVVEQTNYVMLDPKHGPGLEQLLEKVKNLISDTRIHQLWNEWKVGSICNEWT